MQTIERPSEAGNPRQTPPWGRAALIVGGILLLPLLLLAIFNKWGVLILVVVAATAGIIIWVWYRGLVLVEVIAFLIHFDGIGAGPISMGRVIAGLVGILLVYKLAVERWRPPAVPFRNWAPVWFLVTWAVVSGAWSADSGLWIQTLGMLGLALVYFCITSMLIDSHRGIQQFLRAFWFGGLFGSVLGILALFLGTRSVGFGGDPNFFGLLQASMIPLTVYYRRHAHDERAKWIYTLALAVVLAGAAGAGSRSGLIAGAIAIVATMVTRPGLSPIRRTRVAAVALIIAPIAFLVGFVANVNNLERGFSDRGAGRLDFWSVTVDMIQNQPIAGYGLGQIQAKIPKSILVNPGSKRLNEQRDAVSAHNTWLDVTGDLGVVGLVAFVSVFGVAVFGLLRPRWPHLKEVSTLVFVMLLPVFSSSMFLPLLNNKLAWAVLGLTAALQTPSADSRWSGLAGERPLDRERQRELPRAHGTALVHANAPGGGQTPAEWSPAPTVDPHDPQSVPDIELARWDLRLPPVVPRLVIAGGLTAGVVAFAVGSRLPDSFTATTAIMAPRLDTSNSPEFLRFDKIRMQGVLTLPVSGAYAAELKRLSGVDLDVQQVRRRMSVERPEMGGLIRFTYSDTSEANTKAVQPFMVTALNNVYADARALAGPQTSNEARPMTPGEQRYYTGPGFLPVYREAVFGIVEPRVSWMTFTSTLGGALVVLGVAFSLGRRPRVRSTDDYFGYTGVNLWTRVGGGRSRRDRTTPSQLAHLAARIVEEGGASGASRVVVAPPRIGAPSRRLAVGLAAALVAQGRRVVLVDAQIDHPMLSLKMGVWRTRGLAARVHGSPGETADVGPLELRPVDSKRLPPEARDLVGEDIDRMKFVGGGSFIGGHRSSIDVAALDGLDESVTVVVLAPALAGRVGVSALLEWSNLVVIAMRTGLTSTEAAEDATGAARLFSKGPTGIVLSNA